VIFKPRPDQSIRIAYNRAYRAPSLVDNFLQTTIPNAISLGPTQRFVFQTRAAGNENLRAELVDALELGYTAAVARRALITAALYRNDVRNNIVFVPTQFYSPSDPPAGWPGNPSTVPRFVLPKTFSFLNVGRVRDQGVEVSWDMNWNDAVSTRTAYTYEDDPKVSNDRSTPLQVNRPPHHQGSVLASVRQPRWFASAGATYTDKAFWADVLDSRFWGTTRAYVNANAAIGLFANAATQVAVKSTNILDRKIKEHVFGDIIRRKTTVELRYRF
jgi:outer membrane receptor protein involved in Fe transport